jgi:hypothetical protein
MQYEVPNTCGYLVFGPEASRLGPFIFVQPGVKSNFYIFKKVFLKMTGQAW